MDKIGDRLITDKREELKESQGAILGKDILTVLIKSVMQEGAGSKLTDEEVRARTSLGGFRFLLASFSPGKRGTYDDYRWT